MKKVYIFLTAICLVALTGCIKEDVDLTQANVSMSISTRVNLNSSSVEQGDAIGDINVWAFACDEDGNVSSTNDKAVAWRHIPNADTYTYVDVHLQFTTCDDDADHYYKLVTVINKGEFGTVSGITSFDRNTTYSQLANAKFQATELMATATATPPGNGAGSTPGQMPISHWKVITLNNSNNGSTHPDCVEVSMPVYRAVAKTQLFVAKTDASTNLVIKNVTIGSSAFPNEGVLLSAAAGQTVEVVNEDGTKTEIAGDLIPSNEPSWDNNIKVGTETNNNASDNTYEMPLTLTTPNSIPVLLKDNHPAENSTSYAYITSHFLYENKIGNTPWNTTNPTAGGYYMDVTYNVGSGDKTERVWLPAVVRNHDYQVRALVDAGGRLNLNLKVKDWTDAEKIPDVNYEDNVTIKGGLTWSGNGTNDPANSTYTFGPNAGQTAICSFTLETPKGGTWYAELAEGDINDFAFVITDENGTKTSKTVSGSITGEQASFTIKTLTQNSLDQRRKSVKLRLTAETADGRMLTVYLGDDIDYYTIIQTQN